MKKILFILLLFILAFGLSSCDKTDVENDLQSNIENQELLTDEEADILHNENQEFQEEYMKAIADATEDERMDEQIALIDDIEEWKIDKANWIWLKRSCNSIEESSVCLEYYWSFWNEDSAKLNCADSGVFSTKPCPEGSIGWCNTWVETAADMVAWMYLWWAWEMTEQSVKYAQMACDATLGSNWITGR